MSNEPQSLSLARSAEANLQGVLHKADRIVDGNLIRARKEQTNRLIPFPTYQQGTRIPTLGHIGGENLVCE